MCEQIRTDPVHRLLGNFDHPDILQPRSKRIKHIDQGQRDQKNDPRSAPVSLQVMIHRSADQIRPQQGKPGAEQDHHQHKDQLRLARSQISPDPFQCC
ncbi:hypothetical protein D3C81_1778850 [compost metagenome]